MTEPITDDKLAEMERMSRLAYGALAGYEEDFLKVLARIRSDAAEIKRQRDVIDRQELVVLRARAKMRVAEEALELIANDEPNCDFERFDLYRFAREALAKIRETKCPSDLGPIRAVPQGREDGCELEERNK